MSTLVTSSDVWVQVRREPGEQRHRLQGAEVAVEDVLAEGDVGEARLPRRVDHPEGALELLLRAQVLGMSVISRPACTMLAAP